MTILGISLTDAAAFVTIVSGIIAAVAFIVKEKNPTMHIIVIILIVAVALALLKGPSTEKPPEPSSSISPPTAIEPDATDSPPSTPADEPITSTSTPTPTTTVGEPSREVIFAEANALYSKVLGEWIGYNAVNTSDHNYYVDDGDLVWIIDRTECWAEYYYIDGKVRFAIIQENRYSTEALRMYFYNDELIRLINLEKEYIYAGDNSEEFEEMKVYAEKAASIYTNAMSYIQRFAPQALE